MYLRVGSVWFFVARDHSKPNLLLKRGTKKWGGILEFYMLICEQEFFRKQESYSFFWERFLYPINQEGEFQRASSCLYVITYSVQPSEICIICIKKEKRLLLTAFISMKCLKFISFFYGLWVLTQVFEINNMISCKTDAAGTDCCSGWQVLKRPQTREYRAEEWLGGGGEGGRKKFIKEDIYKN